MLQNWLFTLLQADLHDFIFDKMEHFPIGILGFKVISMKMCLSNGVGRKGANDRALCTLPAKSLDHILVTFFWGYVNDKVYRLFPTNTDDMKSERIVDRDMLRCIWEKFSIGLMLSVLPVH